MWRVGVIGVILLVATPVSAEYVQCLLVCDRLACIVVWCL